MVSRKEKDSKSKKKTRVIFGREKSEDALIKAIKKMAEKAGMEFIPSKKRKK